MSLNRTLICKSCGKEFTFTAKEQEFFAQKGFHNDPVRCKECRAKMRQEKADRQSAVICNNCGKSEIVSFTISHPEHLLCDDCFAKLKPAPPTPPAVETPEAGTLEVTQLDD